jgi:hypothetical protein
LRAVSLLSRHINVSLTFREQLNYLSRTDNGLVQAVKHPETDAAQALRGSSKDVVANETISMTCLRPFLNPDRFSHLFVAAVHP